MKKIILTSVFLSISGVAICAQQPVATPPADNDVVKISTNLIQIDVSVTDKKGNVVTDLRPDEIEIYENGEKQKISNFSFIANVRPGETERPAGSKDVKNPVILPSGPVRPERVRRAIALVVDDLSLSFASSYWVQRAARKFVNEQMQDGDLVAIIRTGAGIGALQQFTTDKRQLLAAVDKIKFNLAGNGRIGVFNPVTAPLNRQPAGESQGDDPAGDETGDRAEDELNELRESIFASGTLGALNYVIRGMRDLPGRKSIVLLSDGFRLFVRDRRGSPEATRILDSLRRLTDLANRASVVVYTIDARGLVTTGFSAEDDLAERSGEDIERLLQGRRNELIDSQDGLIYLAKQTGGFAVINSNDITRGIRRVLDDQSFYLVGYVPDDETFDPRTRKYNKIEVKVSRPGTRVRYRSGFFGIADESVKPPAMTVSQKLMNALTSPFAANEIPVRLTALFAADAKGSAHLRSFIHVDGGHLKYERQTDGTYTTVFDVIAYSFGDNGIAVDSLGKTFTASFSEAAYKQVLKSGFIYEFHFPVKKPGGYQVRVAIRNSAENTVGSANQFIDVPNLKKDRIALSGVILQSLEPNEWDRIEKEPSAYDEIRKRRDIRMATTLRQFKRGAILRWGMDIYNAKPSADLSKQVRIFRDGKVVFEGPTTSISGTQAAGSPTLNGVLRLGEPMGVGEYILQIQIINNGEKGKKRVVSQFVQFEIVE